VDGGDAASAAGLGRTSGDAAWTVTVNFLEALGDAAAKGFEVVRALESLAKGEPDAPVLNDPERAGESAEALAGVGT
jgi:hypothetical protein